MEEFTADAVADNVEATEEATDEVLTDEAGLEEDASEKVSEPDYERIMEEDLAELKREFPEIRRINSLTELKNPLRYAALRDLGLTPEEAYLASRGKVPVPDNRAHLSHSAPRAAGAPSGGMTRSELEGARELFFGMSDSEIQSLYRRVTK